jgi:hypothetical protein
MQPTVWPLVSIISNFQRPLQMKIWKKRNKSRRFVATLPSLRIGLRHKHNFHSPFFLVVSFVPLFCLPATERNQHRAKTTFFRLDVVLYTAVLLSWFLEKPQTRTAVRPRSSTIVVLDSARKGIVSLDANVKLKSLSFLKEISHNFPQSRDDAY